MRWAFYRLVLVVTGAGLAGCPKAAPEPPIWERVKIGDLTSSDPNLSLSPLDTTDLTLHAFEIPVDRLKKLKAVWDRLNTRSIRYRNHYAFRSNAFRVAKGALRQWPDVYSGLCAAGAVHITTIQLMLGGSQPEDLPVTILPQPVGVSFVGKDIATETLTIGPGVLALRLRLDGLQEGTPGPIQISGYPVVTVTSGHAVKALAERAKQKEVAFVTSAFSTLLSQDDLLVLGPEDFCGDTSTLGGLFFWNPSSTALFEPGARHRPTHAPARVLVIICTKLRETNL